MEISLSNVEKHYVRKGKGGTIREIPVLSKIDFSLKSEKIIRIIGESGCGKSTLMNMICGMLPPSSGSIVYNGRSIYDLGDDDLSLLRNRKFGIVPQRSVAVGSLSVDDNIRLPFLYASSESSELKERTEKLLQYLNISGLADSFPNELSGGEMRRVCIARSLINEPEFIFADEPTNDLDKDNMELVLSLLRKKADEGVGVMIISHDSSVGDYADETYRVADGQVVRI